MSSLPLEVVEAIRQDRAVLFVGSRASAEAAARAGRDYPSDFAIAKALGWEKPRQIMASRARPVMPSIEKGAARTEAERGRLALLNELRRHVAVPDVPPTDAHRIAVRRFPLVFTTCWDDLLERAAREAGQPLTVTGRTDPLPVPAAGTCALVKLRGGFDRPDRMAITARDYEQSPFTADFRRAARKLLHERTILFVGYRLDEEEFERLWEDLTDAYGGELPRCHLAVSHGRMDDFLWQKWVWRGLLLFTADPEECLREVEVIS